MLPEIRFFFAQHDYIILSNVINWEQITFVNYIQYVFSNEAYSAWETETYGFFFRRILSIEAITEAMEQKKEKKLNIEKTSVRHNNILFS